MKRLMKQASEYNVRNIGEAIAQNSEAGNAIKQLTESWLEDNIEHEEDLDSLLIQQKFTEAVSSNPNELFEAVIDLVPEDGDDDKLYNAGSSDKEEIVQLLLQKFSKEIDEAIKSAIADEEIIRNESSDDENNSPYGPGMSQKDFI